MPTWGRLSTRKTFPELPRDRTWQGSTYRPGLQAVQSSLCWFECHHELPEVWSKGQTDSIAMHAAEILDKIIALAIAFVGRFCSLICSPQQASKPFTWRVRHPLGQRKQSYWSSLSWLTWQAPGFGKRLGSSKPFFPRARQPQVSRPDFLWPSSLAGWRDLCLISSCVLTSGSTTSFRFWLTLRPH